MTALENEAVFVVANWASGDTAKYTEELDSSRVVFLPSPQLLGNIFTLFETLTFVHTQ